MADPNPRLDALIAAACRGACVRAVTALEGLDLQARLGNPTARSIHAKLLLARIGGEIWSAVGSLNGGEVSFKLNREVVLVIDQPAIYTRLAVAFTQEWALK